jgi:hypothetical protein
MSDHNRHQDFLEGLGTYGSDLSRWPKAHAEGLREALLADTGLRRAYDAERPLDRSLAQLRGEWDAEIAASGAAARVRRDAARRVVAPLAGFGWRRVAAAVLVAGMLGGAVDVALLGAGTDATAGADIVMLDPLDTLDETAVP